VWADVDSVWEQEKPEARKMLENAARREAAVPSVQCALCWATFSQPSSSNHLYRMRIMRRYVNNKI
jgi:hypothetical protein